MEMIYKKHQNRMLIIFAIGIINLGIPLSSLIGGILSFSGLLLIISTHFMFRYPSLNKSNKGLQLAEIPNYPRYSFSITLIIALMVLSLCIINELSLLKTLNFIIASVCFSYTVFSWLYCKNLKSLSNCN